MTDIIAGYLVWVPGLKGFTAQKWLPGFQPAHDAPAPVARYPLNAEQFSMKLAILEQWFAPPPETEEPKVKLEASSA